MALVEPYSGGFLVSGNTTLFLTLNEVARKLRLAVTTVRRYVREGRLPAARFGRAYRVSSEDLAAFIAQARKGR